jgi:RIO kinase 1
MSHVDIRKEEDMGVERFYDALTGLKINDEEGDEEAEDEVEEADEAEEDEDSSDEDDDENIETGFHFDDKTVCLTGMTKEEKKAHKKRVKEEKREKRKEKMSKYDKKKSMAKGKFKK